ncbi:MAG: alpha-glucuronidase, partial [Oscillospiraceae bacterium]|nr:alpha-glucuronidase [Oscillospiraceae bacterium]
MGICRVKEYDCWLQERGANSFSAQTVDALSVICANINGDIATNAVNELREGLLKRFGIQSKCVISSDAPCITARVNGASDIGAEGFKIKSENGGVVIEGADERGLLYGVYYFMRELSLGADISTMDITEVPAGAIRMINHWDNIDGSIERGYAGRSVFFSDSKLSYDPVRIKDYARLLASVGINLLSINNVTVRFEAKRLITEDHLPRIAELAAVFRPFGVRLVLSINFSAPYSYGDLDTADPLDPGVAQWWKDRADLVYKYIPDLAGFLVKADSEGEPGPFQYGRDHTDGANMLAKALKPHGGDVIWRCFVYNSTQDWRDHTQDRPCAAYSHFLPLDGRFDDNVILQIKNGPLDFQVYEPVSPLFGALSKTRHIMEFQVTQEYTGQQIDVCYLPFMWQDVMRFDTKHGENATIAAMIGGRIEGIA